MHLQPHDANEIHCSLNGLRTEKLQMIKRRIYMATGDGIDRLHITRMFSEYITSIEVFETELVY